MYIVYIYAYIYIHISVISIQTFPIYWAVVALWLITLLVPGRWLILIGINIYYIYNYIYIYIFKYLYIYIYINMYLYIPSAWQMANSYRYYDDDDDDVYFEYYSGKGFHINYSYLHVVCKTHKLIQ
jgi:hypothetical protein